MLTCPSTTSPCPASALVSLATHEVGAQLQRALAERGRGGVVHGQQRAGGVRGRGRHAAMSPTSSPGLDGVSSSTSAAPSSTPAGHSPAVGTSRTSTPSGASSSRASDRAR